MVKQLQFQTDVIEVLGGMCLKLSSRGFIKCPLKESEIGFIFPCSFQNYDIENSPKDMETSVFNSFPEIHDRENFCNKMYQYLLYDQLLQKVRKLVVCGESNSGKTYWAQMFFGLINPSKIATLTQEKAF